MAPAQKRQRVEKNPYDRRTKKKKIVVKQHTYHSSSEDEPDEGGQEFAAVNLQDSDDNEHAGGVRILSAIPSRTSDTETLGEGSANSTKPTVPEAEEPNDESLDAPNTTDDTDADADEEDEDDDDDDDDDNETVISSVHPSETSTQAERRKAKRNDPAAFAESMSKILSSNLSKSKRVDPVLARSKTAEDAAASVKDAKLETKAKNKLKAEKKEALDKGRVKDVLGLDSTDVSTAAIQEKEKQLRKTAQRGVVKLFNAVRAAQVKGEEAAREARTTGMVGLGRREEKVNEMSKKGFLDLIATGGKKMPETTAEA